MCSPMGSGLFRSGMKLSSCTENTELLWDVSQKEGRQLLEALFPAWCESQRGEMTSWETGKVF